MFEIDTPLLRRLYFQTGLSLRQFAKSAGLNQLTIRRLILAKRSKTNGKIIAALAKYFGVNPETLLLKKESEATA